MCTFGSSMKKSQHDNGVNTYMKDLDNVRRLERRQEKFKTRLAMQKKSYSRVLSSDKGELFSDKAQRGNIIETIPEGLAGDQYDDDTSMEKETNVQDNEIFLLLYQ